MLPLLLLACAGEPSTAPAPGAEPPEPITRAAQIRFKALPAPSPNADSTAIMAELADGQGYSWHPLLHQGTSYGDGPPFGTVSSVTGEVLEQHDQPTCRAPDGNALLQAHGKTWLLTHQECTPSALYLSELSPAEGGFTVSSSRPVDLSAVGGLNQLCAADLTPWGSMLGGQEYETDAALWVDGAVEASRTGMEKYTDNSGFGRFVRFASEPAEVSPYANGWVHESRVLDAEGSVQVQRRFVLGRFSHELARVMPDQRTVYLSDDNSYGILAIFVADQAGDLSAGTLYAARFQQSAPDGSAALSWVRLGHATDAELQAALDGGLRFQQLFERQLAGPDDCPDGFSPYRAPQSVDECLKAVPGSETLAAFFETRRSAALAGATAELQKEEGLAVDPEARRLYVAITRVSGGMLADDPPRAEADHLALEPNPCGLIYGLELAGGASDSAGQAIDSDWVARSAAPVVVGRAMEDGSCDPASFSEPDNLAFIPGADILLIAEDTDRAPNMLWAWQEGQLLPLFAAYPRTGSGLAEVSGLGWFPSVDGAGWISLSLQHPGELPATVGLLGPFPAAR